MESRLPFICPECAKASWNREDLKHGWCNACKKGWFERGAEEAIQSLQCKHVWKYTSDWATCLKCGISKPREG